MFNGDSALTCSCKLFLFLDHRMKYIFFVLDLLNLPSISVRYEQE